MPFDDHVQVGLEQAGFRNWCFISYPHTGGAELADCARQLQRAIREELSNDVGGKPEIYLDQDIPPGVEWPEDLRINLSASVAMVAIVIRNYLSERHEWCGREWAAMEQLGRARLGNHPAQPIIPVLYRETPLPESATSKQVIDISRQAVLGKRYYSTKEFREKVRRIVKQILDIACLLHKNGCRAGVPDFQWPDRSAFSDVEVPRQAPPGRSQ